MSGTDSDERERAPAPSWRRREAVLIGAIRDGSLPPARDIDRFARRIWEEVEGAGAGEWTSLSANSPDRRRTLRIARLALGLAPPVDRGAGGDTHQPR